MSKLVAITGAGEREEKAVDADRLVEGSPRTVSNQLRVLYRTLGGRTRADLVKALARDASG